MANNPNATANLIPAKPGEPSRNPNGRPKGRRSLSTMVRDILEKDINYDTLPLKDAKEFSELYKGKAAGEALVLSAVAKALDGDGSAREWLRRSGYGDKIDLTSDEKPIPILGGLIVQTNDGPAEDSGDGQADQDSAGGDGSRQDDSDPDAPEPDSPDKE